MPFLLDTNAWVGAMRNRPAPLAVRLAAAPQSEIFSCSVVLAGLLFGAEGAANPVAEAQRVHQFVGAFPSLPFDDQTESGIARLGSLLSARGEQIDALDLMIASVALQHDLTLVTHNVRHFSRVPGLRWEDWES